MRIFVCDIGGTAIKYAVMNKKAEILSRGKIPTPKEGRDKMADAIAEIFEQEGGAEGIAISMPGIIDYENGVILMGGGGIPANTGYPMRRALADRVHVPVILENDAKCAAMAEAASGALSDVPDGIVLIFGTNIGGGIIKDHKLHRGKHASAGEVTYIIPDNTSAKPDTVWGVRCGVPYLCRYYAENIGADPETVDGVQVFAAAAEKKEEALAALDRYTREIAVQIFNLQTVFDPDRFAIGGGISEQPVFLEYIKKHLDALYDDCPFLLPRAEVTACFYHNDANLVGALSCYLADMA